MTMMAPVPTWTLQAEARLVVSSTIEVPGPLKAQWVLDKTCMKPIDLLAARSLVLGRQLTLQLKDQQPNDWVSTLLWDRRLDGQDHRNQQQGQQLQIT